MNSDNAVRYLRLGPYDIRLSCSALTDAIVASELDALQATMNNRLANTQKLTPAIRSMLTTTGASEWIDLIYHVYTRACHCNSNQTITIKGVSSAAKTDIIDMAIRHLLHLGSSRAQSIGCDRFLLMDRTNFSTATPGNRYLAARFLLQAFGSTRTIVNNRGNTGSEYQDPRLRFGAISSFMFDTLTNNSNSSGGKLTHFHIQPFLLETDQCFNNRQAAKQQYREMFDVFFMIIDSLTECLSDTGALLAGIVEMIGECKSSYFLAEIKPTVRSFRYLSQDSNNGGLASIGKFLFGDSFDHQRKRDDSTTSDMKAALRTIGLSNQEIVELFRVLFAILLAGNLEFKELPDKRSIQIQPAEYLQMIKELLRLDRSDYSLEAFLTRRNINLKPGFPGEGVSINGFLLDRNMAERNRDRFSQTLYSLLWEFLLYKINSNFPDAEPAVKHSPVQVNIVDLPASILSVDEASFEYFLWNFAAEKIHFFREPNSASKDLCMLAFSEPSGGILGCMEKISVDYSLTEEKNAILLMQSIARLISANHKMQRLIDLFPSKQVKGTSIGREFTFRIHHHSRNNVSSYDVLNGRFISRNKSYHCIPFEFYNDFVLKRLDNLNFIGKLAQNHSRLLTRQGDPLLNSWLSGIQPQDWSSCTSAMSVFSRNIDFLIDSTMKTGECFHVEFFESGRVGKPNDFPAKPVILFPIEMDCIRKIVPSVFDSGDSEQLNYDSISSILSLNLGFQRKIDWDFDRQGRLLIGQIAWRFLMNKLSAKPADSVALSTKISPKIPDILVKSDNSINSKSPVVRRRGSVRNIRDTNDPNMWMGTQVDGLASSEKTKSRKFWLYISWMLTFWLTDCFLVQILGKKNATVRMAFREKLSLCILFGIANATCIVVLLLVNPNWTSNNRLIFQQDFKRIARRTPSLLMVFRSGRIWTIGAKVGSNDPRFDQIVPFVGLDVTRYPRTDYQSINQCPQLTNTNARSARDAAKMINTTGQPLLTTPRNALDDPSLYDTETLYAYMAFYREDVLWRQDFVNHSSVWLMANKNIYNLTEYFSRSYLPFFSEQTESIFKRYAGKELPPEVQTNLEAGVLECLDQLFMAGKLGFQPSIVENLLQNIITGALVISLLIIYVKFAAGAPIPRWTKHNKPFVQYIQQYVIMFVPCYTEHRQSLEQTIRSLAESDYPDDKKLIFVVCDGMVAGESSNGVLTPRIVLDILGSSGSLDDAQSFPFDSTGESHSAYNEAKVYTGYFVSGAHRVPYFVIVKIGHPSEQKKPGNRGKRDSQAILMTFLSKVYYQQLMNPLELEIFYQMHHFLNIRPEWYEYVLMVDADTVVSRNGLAELMNQIAFDPDMLGICGETTVANPFASFITAVQVFEYFISHRLSKAFESLFGIVTCLPGCFSLWRIKSKERNMAILASKDIIVEFKSSRTDTLHSKNLLLLGEDRYLTTLMLKNFSGMSTCFNSAATCKTSVPTSFNVLLSQRRRWINSTIHNLAELLFLNSFSYGLVGTRFLMLIDLVSNILLPGSFVFMIVMIYQSIISPVLPYIALLLTGCFYGVQALLVILSGHFSQLGWMICYLIGSVMFHFVFPIYAFWHFDNFTWGSTRIVAETKRREPEGKETMEYDSYNIEIRRPDPNETGWRVAYVHGKHRIPDQIVKTNNSTRSDTQPPPTTAPSPPKPSAIKITTVQLHSNIAVPTKAASPTTPQLTNQGISGIGVRKRSPISPIRQNESSSNWPFDKANDCHVGNSEMQPVARKFHSSPPPPPPPRLEGQLFQTRSIQQRPSELKSNQIFPNPIPPKPAGRIPSNTRFQGKSNQTIPPPPIPERKPKPT